MMFELLVQTFERKNSKEAFNSYLYLGFKKKKIKNKNDADVCCKDQIHAKDHHWHKYKNTVGEDLRCIKESGNKQKKPCCVC